MTVGPEMITTKRVVKYLRVQLDTKFMFLGHFGGGKSDSSFV